MDFGILVAVYPLVFLAELPDKTMFASLVLATRGRPFAVWLGAAGAFAVHVAIATTVGVALFHVLSHQALEAIVAGLFFGGGLLALREARKQRDEEDLVEKEAASHRRTVLTAFLVIFIAEWGDLTQIVTANLAAHYHNALSVAVGSVLAMWTVAALAVVSGQSVLRFVNISIVRVVTAVVLFGLAGWAAWGAAH